MSQRNFVKDQLHTERGPLFLLCSFHPFIFFLSFGKFVSAAHRGHPLGPPVFLSRFFVFFSFPSLFSSHVFSAFPFCSLPFIEFSSVAFSREILLMYIAGSTYAESNASTGRHVNCPMKINMVLFFLTYPTQTCTRRSEASTLQRTEQNYVLSSSRLSQYHRLASLGHQADNGKIVINKL